MGCLLDTNVVLRALIRPADLRSPVRRAIDRGPNLLSVVVYWETMLKSMKGLLDIGEPSLWWRDALDQLSARPLLLRPEHVSELHALPPIHRDPFDRMLLAQAAAEGLTLVSSDRDLARYKSSRIRILS